MKGSVLPTARLIGLTALGLPISILAGILVPALWSIGAAWIVFMIAFGCLDLWLAPRISRVSVEVEVPAAMHIGREQTAHIRIASGRTPLLRASAALTSDSRLRVSPDPAPISDNRAEFTLAAVRRGLSHMPRLWLRWTGPLGLIALQKVSHIDRDIAIIPDTALVRDMAANLFSRDATLGLKIDERRGEGTEFDALVEFSAGMDRRAIDWKHSARHQQLHAKEYRTERNHNIIFAFDSGHLMCEPLADETSDIALTKLDRAVNAALLMSFISLKLGDKVGLFAFDERPYLYTRPVGGTTAFAQLQALTARVDYSHAESNYVLGLSELSRRLSRRSLIVVFADFVDTVSAELMVENMSRLVRRHLVIFVTFADRDVETLLSKRPDTSDDIARAIVAGTLAAERDLVLAKLARLGVQILETTPEQLNLSLLNRFLDIKRRELL